jgi:hypothetical protein
MVDDTKKAEELAAKIEMITPPAPAAAISVVAEVRLARVRIGSEPTRLSKGQRKHIRRKKEAGEAKVIDRRR